MVVLFLFSVSIYKFSAVSCNMQSHADLKFEPLIYTPTSRAWKLMRSCNKILVNVLIQSQTDNKQQSSTGTRDGAHGLPFPGQRPDLTSAVLTTMLLGHFGEATLC